MIYSANTLPSSLPAKKKKPKQTTQTKNKQKKITL